MWLHSVLLSIALSWLCSAELTGPPLILLNDILQKNQTDVVLKAGFAFNLSCHGNTSLHLSSTALVRLRSNQRLEVRKSNPRHTGTYRCGYMEPSLKHLNSWIHLYVTDMEDRASAFVSSARDFLSVEQGEDVLVKCFVTDPTITNLTLQSENRKGLPPDMKVTFDLRRGALIHAATMTFSGRYVCSGIRDGNVVTSRPIQLLVMKRRQLGPPSVSIVQNEFVRLIGERFEITCVGSNPSHLYTLSWTHDNVQRLNSTIRNSYTNGHLYMNSTIIIHAVHLEHDGLYTCEATNEVGTTVARARLRVLERPYLNIRRHRHHSQIPSPQAGTMLKANATSSPLVTNTSSERAHSANVSDSKEEVFEGQDVTLTFVIDSYPPVKNHSWKKPKHLEDKALQEYQETYTADGYRSEFSLFVHRVHQEDRGQYSFHYANLFFNGSENINLRIYRPPSASVAQDGDVLSCNGSGYPLPAIVWFSCHGDGHTCEDISTNQLSTGPVNSRGEEDEEDENEVRTILPLSPDDDVTIECEASNLLGVTRAVFRPRPSPTIFTLPLIGALTSSAFLLLLLLVLLYKCKQKPRYEVRWKIIECTDGNNYTFIDPTQLPYDREWEFPRDKLRLGAVLGSGAFGKVVEATAYGLGNDDVTLVAVKMLKPSAHSEEREALMSELKILSHLGYHDNIVNLLGACTKGGPMLMITEYCRHGDLLNFLRGHAQHFLTSMLTVDKMEDAAFYKNMSTRLRSDSGISCCSEYQDLKLVQTHTGVQADGLSVTDLLWFSYQVARGLDFLSSRNCIHRDVAARNVLLTDGRVAKICDFGLARDIRNDDSYIVQGNARLPVKWMSPESIFQCVYTVQSDVWSYGVLLWEIFSLGRSPYPNIAVDTNFYKMIKDGRHMEQPDFAPTEIYELMTLCWSLEPTERPTFKTIGQLIHRLLPSTDDTSAQHADQPTYRNIDECREEEDDEEEEMGGVMLKRGGEERGERRDDHDKEPDPMMKNIYQRS